ncbi:hypothetical protein [Rhizobium rhizophilum]|uniref:Uncharacterized protein n=1 Tax=Rhizobium rhizophilum TaxID=1850373 RepID=A0ABY2QRT5_9HYPH|nr:hypothetical protein [Rhizobium rhizophilum]THV12693.1 hypothetical protein E9677_18380 [Rhizobium rhizophilum]
MRLFLTRMISTIVLLSPLVGEMQAQASISMNWPTELAGTIATFNGGFNVQNVRHYNTDRDNQNPSAKSLRERDIALIQRAIRSNSGLADKLALAGVNVAHVVNAQQAANGNITFWIR